MASSIAVMPTLHMSALASYRLCWITSGAIQNGVPTNVFLGDHQPIHLSQGQAHKATGVMQYQPFGDGLRELPCYTKIR